METAFVSELVVSNLAPGWEACKPVRYGVWDPPVALKSQKQLEIIQSAGSERCGRSAAAKDHAI